MVSPPLRKAQPPPQASPVRPRSGLYVHVPFCETKCGYCDFYSIPLGNRQTSPLVQAILTELKQRQPAISRFHTIFVGGGTPTVLPPDQMQALFERLGRIATDHDVVEFTTEANPATVDERKIALLATCGVNRISFGGQSFHQNELNALERLHDPADIAPSIELARRGGIRQINLDLMFGIPGQTLSSWRESLRRGVDLGPDHLACYGLTYEPNTALTARMRRSEVTPCDNDLEAEMYLACIEFLEDNGYTQYEISNYAKPGGECQHNIIYWMNWPYLGLGPSAASYIDGVRSKNVAHVETYVQAITRNRLAICEHESLSGQALAGETAMLHLRLNRGIHVGEFEAQVGLNPLEVFAEPLRRHAQDGLLEIDADSIRLTSAGRLLADRVIGDFLVLSEAVAS